MISFIRQWSSFTYLNATQFLGALNDNIYKMLIVFFFINLEGIEYSHEILATTGAIFVLPFILFSAMSGTLADRYSKRNIIVLTKILELITMTLGVLAFHYESKIGSYLILFLMATQSAIFGPSKYGILPELVDSEKISRANGLMTSFTFIAIMIGTFLASFIIQVSGRDFIVGSLFCTVIALAGVFTSFCIEYTPPSGSQKRFNIRFVYEIYKTLKLVKQEPSLLAAVFGSAFFLFLAAFVQLNMIPFAVQSLGLSDVQGGYLFLLTAIGIGTGAVLAGRLSGSGVELGLVSIGGTGVTLCCFLLDRFSHSLYIVIPLVIILGIFGGMYMIPLDSFIQVASPNQYRGQVVAATNFLSFIGVLLASAALYIITETLGLQADKGFTVMGGLALCVTITIGYIFFDYLTRFLCTGISRLHFQTTLQGQDNIPDTPAVYVCTHTAWNDTLLILGAQRRRMRFFIEQEQEHSYLMKKLYHMLRVVFVPTIERLEKNNDCLKAIEKSLSKGISVCIFTDNPDTSKEIDKLMHSYSFKEILERQGCPIIPVYIDKGTKSKQPRFFVKLLRKFRVPASISFGSSEKDSKKNNFYISDLCQ
jgi:acyl-[acyl-carrier-protein]-phospholipid O-acyltransferase/long-chain-fatty-acid--[acyl-carrier-protein] ligase